MTTGKLSGKFATAEHVNQRLRTDGRLLWNGQQFRLKTINRTKISDIPKKVFVQLSTMKSPKTLWVPGFKCKKIYFRTRKQFVSGKISSGIN